MVQDRPVLLGVFAHRSVQGSNCEAMECDARAVGFMTVLFHGVVAVAVCREHALEVLRRSEMPRIKPDDPDLDAAPWVRPIRAVLQGAPGGMAQRVCGC